MGTRRMLLGLTFGAAAARRAAAAAQPTGQAGGEGGLRDRGAPTGRTGAATRGARSGDGELTLDLVAPLRGVGLTAADQPELCYLLSNRTARPMRLAISTPGQARPLANLALPHAPPPGLGVIRLRDHGTRLPPNLLCVWSVTVAFDPRAPSQDLVGSALIQYRPGDPALSAAGGDALPGRIAALADAGYWYDAVALAEQNQGSDHGAALAALFKQANLPLAAGPTTPAQ